MTGSEPSAIRETGCGVERPTDQHALTPDSSNSFKAAVSPLSVSFAHAGLRGSVSNDKHATSSWTFKIKLFEETFHVFGHIMNDGNC